MLQVPVSTIFCTVTASAFHLSVSEQGAVALSPRYSQDSHLFEFEVEDLERQSTDTLNFQFTLQFNKHFVNKRYQTQKLTKIGSS